MRCPKCGHENAPDSRFCGVCGLPQAQVHSQAQRLAPTAKISDDAPFAPPTRQVAPITPVAGVSYSPPSMPPQNVGGLAQPQQAGLTTRPGGHAAPPRTGDHANVRPSGDYQQVRPSGQAPGRQSFDSITPTGRQERTPMPSQHPSGQRPLSNAPMASNPSMSFSAAPHRSLGLIAIVLVVDLGLAGAGAFLLAKGMSKPKAEKIEKAPDKKSELSTPAPAAAATGPAPAAAVVAAARGAAPAPVTATPIVAAPAAADASRVETTATAAARSKTPRGSGTSTTTAATAPSLPVTSPSATPSATTPSVGTPETTTVQPLSTAAQIDRLANQSAMAFERCRGDQAPAGAITVAFNVQPDGTVADHQAVSNTTGNPELGACLARVVGGWRVSPFQGNAMSFMRPFTYP